MRRKAVKLPADYLTAGQRKELNGTVKQYTMNEPHTYLELLAFPKDLRKQYLENIINNYHPSIKQLTEMMRTDKRNIYEMLEALEIDRAKRAYYKRPEEKKAWYKFLGVEEPDMIVTDPEPAPAPKLELVKKEQPVIHMTYPQVGYLEVGLTGKPFVVADSLTRFLDPNKEYRFAIQVYEANSTAVANTTTMEEPYGERDTGTED